MAIFSMPRPSAFGQHLSPSDGAKLYFFTAGTTTPKASYTDSAEGTPHAVPVVADANGRFAAIYISGLYKARLLDKNDVQIWEEDGLQGRGGDVAIQGTFDSSTNGGDYPLTGSQGDAYTVATGFALNTTSGNHILQTGDMIYANKNGATPIDADWNIIRGVVNSIGALALTDEANISTDCEHGTVFTVTLTDNRTLDNPTNKIIGTAYTWVITQDAGGTNTLAFGTDFDFSSRATIDLTGDSITVIRGMCTASGAIKCSIEATDVLIDNDLTVTGRALIDDTTDATTTTNGSLQTDGGLSVVKKVYIGETITSVGRMICDAADDATSTTTGAIKTDGGISATKAVYVGGRIRTDDLTQATSTTDGSIQTDGGLSVAKQIYAGGNIVFSDTTSTPGKASSAQIAAGTDDASFLTSAGLAGSKTSALSIDTALETVDTDCSLGTMFTLDAGAYTQTTSGSLVTGINYRLIDWISADDFTNVGAAYNYDGIVFEATGTTPTTWAASSKVRRVLNFTNPTNINVGERYYWVITQDGTGGVDAVWDTYFDFESGSALESSASAVTVIEGIAVTSTSIKCSLMGRDNWRTYDYSEVTHNFSGGTYTPFEETTWFRPYMKTDGTWWLEFRINGVQSGDGGSTNTRFFDITGVSFLDTPSDTSYCTVDSMYFGNQSRNMSGGTGTTGALYRMTIYMLSGPGNGWWSWHGDQPLYCKPSWAD